MWLSATLKYRAGKLEAGPGLHLGIDTDHGAPRRAAEKPVHGLRHVRFPLEDDFMIVFNTAWRLLRAMAAERFPTQAHPTKFDPQHARLVAEIGRNRGLPARECADRLLAGSRLLSVRTPPPSPSPPKWVNSRGGQTRCDDERTPLLVPIPRLKLTG